MSGWERLILYVVDLDTQIEIVKWYMLIQQKLLIGHMEPGY